MQAHLTAIIIFNYFMFLYVYSIPVIFAQSLKVKKKYTNFVRKITTKNMCNH